MRLTPDLGFPMILVVAKHSHMSDYQRAYVEYVRAHPGCCVADVARAVHAGRLTAKRVYDGVSRLRRRGILRAEQPSPRCHAGRVLLFVVEEPTPTHP